MQATVAKHGKKSDLPAISVTLVAAPDSIGMRISDQGTDHHIAQSVSTHKTRRWLIEPANLYPLRSLLLLPHPQCFATRTGPP